MCSSICVDRLCTTSQWSFAAVIQIWDESVACISLNLCYRHAHTEALWNDELSRL